jgi:tetratricopeptide (TPR) repeat protein
MLFPKHIPHRQSWAHLPQPGRPNQMLPQLRFLQKIASSHIVHHLLRQITLFMGLLLGALYAFAQPEGAKNEAWQLATEGHELIAQGEFDKAVQKFSYAHKLVPDNIDIQLGLANAWFFAKEYTKAMQLCKPLFSGKKARPEAYQVYGNCQDAQGQSYEAFETYRNGLKRFPNAGVLHVEMGIVEAARDHRAEALAYWEQGIAVQPTLPASYYFAAQALFEAGDYAWAITYAELFINLARTGERVREMSRLLMRCYERARQYDYQKAFQWRFYQVAAPADAAALATPRVDSLLDAAFASEFTDTAATISIATLAEIRRFVCHMLPTQAPDDPMAGLWQWQQRIVKEGHFEAYTYWMLYDARQEEFLKWFETHRPEYEAFEGWFILNTFYRHIKHPILRVAVAEKQKR